MLKLNPKRLKRGERVEREVFFIFNFSFYRKKAKERKCFFPPLRHYLSLPKNKGFQQQLFCSFSLFRLLAMQRTNYSSGAKWEDIVGYSRAVRVGNIIEVTGTVAVDENSLLVGKDDAYGQTKFIIQKIETVLKNAGASLKDVVRTRMFVTDISRWEEYGKAHGEFFSVIKPCTSMIEVKGLIAPEYLIEIEATAILS
jgi:enamine deaminase RidA (YjgF/YER057c/UK114 family)